jgi:hypothetical protein
VRWRRGWWLRVEADPVDDRAGDHGFICACDHGVISACDHERGRAAHHGGVVAAAGAVGA